MKNLSLALLAAAAIGAISIGSASAMPFGSMSPALGESDVQNVRVVCNRNGHCYNTGRVHRTVRPAYRSVPRYQAQQYYGNDGYYAGPSYGYYDRPLVGFGVGPFGFRVF